MFALELEMSEPSPRSESVFIKKPALIIGGSNSATFQIEELASLDYQLSVARELGRKFRVTPVSTSGEKISANLLAGVYEAEAEFNLGSVLLRITAVDGDLAVKENEPPDRAGVRVLRQSAANKTPYLPALILSDNLSWSP